MRFSELSEYLKSLEETASRNAIVQILASVFRKSAVPEIDKICYLLLGRVSPQYEGIELNFAEKMMVRALARAYGETPRDILKKYKKAGDLGDVAQQAASEKRKTKNEKLSVLEIYERLYKVATESGGGSQERKLELMADLLQALDPLSAKYTARIPIGKMRLGFSDVSMLDALSVMEVGDKSARKRIEAVYNVTADIGKVAKRVKSGGIRNILRITAQPGIPIRGSLAERLPTAQKVAEKLAPKFAVEPKMDGFRTGLHVWTEKGKKKVRIFSRNLENVTSMFPEIVEAAKKLPVKSAIFDGEAIGYSPKTGKFASFQETVQRKRKYGIEEMAKSIPLKVFIFDVLYLNGETLLKEPFSKRREILEGRLRLHTRKEDGAILLADHKVVKSAEELKEMFSKYIGEGLEGAMAKKLDVPYRAGGRGYHWVKFKKNTGVGKNETGLADTIDCVLMGAYRGRGKRVGFGYGGFLLGVPGGGKYYTLSNLGTGLTDEQFREMKKMVDKVSAKDMPKEYIVDKTIAPDVWISPKIVLEILADEITLSPRHTAGRDRDRDRVRGYSLRFPRLIRVRDDKDPKDATSVKEVEKLYKISHWEPSPFFI